ncbi:hypothetical protein K457DRAFT_781215 [Linnemannia elongata AG-77]|uniref:Uncharacterized protein n=1 Tax=Linnemannia elongata AG-77 TaxID=1314771 RepID=A0A197JJF9_9FUNG|nr:hypothetical protein K457DRAFT_781215 [Linnemannia elongata AG-77]
MTFTSMVTARKWMIFLTFEKKLEDLVIMFVKVVKEIQKDNLKRKVLIIYMIKSVGTFLILVLMAQKI